MYQNNLNTNMGFGQQSNTGFGASSNFNLNTGFTNVGTPMPQAAPTLQQIQQAMGQQILALVNGSAGNQIDLIAAANRALMHNGGQNQLFNSAVSMGSVYADYVIRNHHQNPQQTIANTANVIHGAIVAGEKATYQHLLHMYDPGFLQNLDAFSREYEKIANTVRQINATQQQQQNGMISPQSNYQTVNSALGGVQQGGQHAPGVVLLRDDTQMQQSARVITAFDASPSIPGMPPVGTIPTRQIRRPDGSVTDLYSAAEEVHGQTHVAPQQNFQNHNSLNSGVANSYQTDNGQTILRETTGQPESVWDMQQRQIHQRTTGVISQEQDNGEEVAITFNQPTYIQTPEPQNEADKFFNDVFGGSTGIMPTGGWKGMGGDYTPPDPEALAAAGITRCGAASSDLHTSPLDEVEDAFIAEHYPEMAGHQSIASMDAYAQQVNDRAEMYPATHHLSLMELSGNKSQMPQTNVGTSNMANNPAMVEDYASMDSERKAEILANKLNRHIAPVYIAGRSRTVVLKSLGGGKITVEAKANMDYNIHETELLAPAKTALTGKLGNHADADTVLTLALETANEQHYRKVLEEKATNKEDLTDLLVSGPMIVMDNLVAVDSANKYAASAQRALLERLGDRMSEVSMDAAINFNAFDQNQYVLSGDCLALALSITRARTATTIAERAEDFFNDGNLPTREQHRLHALMTAEVNRLLQVTFHPDYRIDSFINDLDDLSTLLHENAEENVRDSVFAIYSQAAKTVFSVYTLASLKKRLADAEEVTGLSSEYEGGLFAEVTNVTLLPFNYADYPLAFEGNIGRITKENLPKLYEVMASIISKRTAEGIYKYSLITEDAKTIEFFKPVLDTDEAFYIVRN